MVEREGLPFTKGRNEYGRVAWIFSRRCVYDWLTEKEYTEYLLGNENDEYGGTEFMLARRPKTQARAQLEQKTRGANRFGCGILER